MHTLRADNLAKSYRGRQVVKDVSLSVTSGQVVGLLGPNGAGKTTCFYMIVGSIPNHQGSVYFDDKNLTHTPVHERARCGIGYLPQDASVFRKLSTEDNLLAVLETRKELSHARQLQHAEALLDEFRIGHIRHSMGAALSGGERRRVEIARALAMEPAFILLDEPFAGVDPISVSDIKSIVSQLSTKGIGILITDHNVRETLDICERAYIVNEGQIIAEGDPATVLADDQVQKVYLGHNFRM